MNISIVVKSRILAGRALSIESTAIAVNESLAQNKTFLRAFYEYYREDNAFTHLFDLSKYESYDDWYHLCYVIDEKMTSTLESVIEKFTQHNIIRFTVNMPTVPDAKAK